MIILKVLLPLSYKIDMRNSKETNLGNHKNHVTFLKELRLDFACYILMSGGFWSFHPTDFKKLKNVITEVLRGNIYILMIDTSRRQLKFADFLLSESIMHSKYYIENFFVPNFTKTTSFCSQSSFWMKKGLIWWLFNDNLRAGEREPEKKGTTNCTLINTNIPYLWIHIQLKMA